MHNRIAAFGRMVVVHTKIRYRYTYYSAQRHKTVVTVYHNDIVIICELCNITSDNTIYIISCASSKSSEIPTRDLVEPPRALPPFHGKKIYEIYKSNFKRAIRLRGETDPALLRYPSGTRDGAVDTRSLYTYIYACIHSSYKL